MEHPGISQASAWIQKSDNILILTHKKIDGDGLSSTLALFRVLKKMHKNVSAVCQDPAPEIFKFLPGTEVLMNHVANSKDIVISILCKETEVDHLRYVIEENMVNIIVSPKKGEITQEDIIFKKGIASYDLIIVLDSPDYEALGSIYESNVDLFFNTPVINIDHHISNTYFGKINIVDITASATTEILYHLFQAIPTPDLIDEDVATLLLSGIIVDTGSFQNPNTTPRAFTTASLLINHGARQQEIIKNIYKTKQLSTLKLWGKVLSNVQQDPIHRIVWSTLTFKDHQNANIMQTDVLDIIDDLLTNAPGSELVLLFIEQQPDNVMLFIKSINPTIDASQIATIFQGSGTYNEATSFFKSSLWETEKNVLDQVCSLQSSRLGITPEEDVKITQITPLKKEIRAMQAQGEIPIIKEQFIEKTIGDSLVEQLKE